jgi:hypothetical protein
MTDILAVNAHTYPTQLEADIEDESASTTTVLAVLVAAPVGRYTCRVGIGNPEWVAKYGDKVSFGLACAHFPNKDLKRQKYQS